MNIVFTYGTLRSGERNHYVLQTVGARPLGQDAITATYCGTWGTDIPLIREGEGTVTGECYEVDDEGMLRLDQFEGTPWGMYVRRTVTTHEGREASVYFPGADLLEDHQG